MDKKKRLAEVLKLGKAIQQKATAEDRDLSEEEFAELTELADEAKTLKEEIKADEELAKKRASVLAELSVEDENRSHQATSAEFTTIQGGAPRVESDPSRGFSSLGELAELIYVAGHSNMPTVHDERLDVLAAASGMSQGVGSDGGWTVPPEFSNTIWDGLNTGVDNLMSRCDRYTITGESLTLLANKETSRATGSRYGGIRGYWIAEADQMTASKPKWRRVKLEPQQLAVFCYVTDKLLKNSSVALTQYLSRAATEEINWLVNDSIFNGNGTGKPLGILNGGGLVTVAKESGQAAATIVANNIHKMFARCHARARRSASWFINQDIEPQMDSLASDSGNVTPIYLPPGGLADAPLGRLKGRPVEPTEYNQTLGTVGDIVLADLKSYALGVQGTIDTAMSMHLRFDYAETAFRFMFAVDGQPWLDNPLTPAYGSNTLSPTVVLATRG